MAKGIKGITVEIGANTGPLESALKTVNKSSRDLQSELRQVERLLKLDPSNTELLAQKQKLLSESIETTREKLDQLKEAEKQVQQQVKEGKISEEQYRAFQREVEATEIKLRGLEGELEDVGDESEKTDKALDETGKTAEKSGGRFEKLGGVLKKVGVFMGGVAAAAGAAAVKLGKEVIQSFGELEQNLGGSEAVFGEYADKIQKIGEDAYKNMGTSQSDYLATANKMGALFQGSGIEQEKSMELTEKAMQRAADMASVMGIDMQMALDSVAGAAKGNFTINSIVRRKSDFTVSAGERYQRCMA